VEASDVRDAPSRYLNFDRRRRRRRALDALRDVAGGRSAIPLPDILEHVGVPLSRRPEVAPLSTVPRVLTIDAATRVHVATDEQLIVLTADVRSLIRRLADAPEHVPPILLVCLAGRLFLNDGHHRLIASRLLGVPVTADVHGLPDPDPASAGQP
jgi:hypothetical protein